MIYVFHLRVYLKIAGVLSCVYNEAIDIEARDYSEAENLAKKEFVNSEPPLKGFTDFDKIEVCNWETA